MPDLDITGRFEAFVHAHQNMVFAVAVRLLADAAEAEDVSQTVFMKAWQHFAALDGNPAAAGWLRTVATNASLNHLARHRRRWKLFSEMSREDDGAESFEATIAAPAADVDAASSAEQLEAALRALPEPQRVPLVLFHFEQKSYQEIASLLGASLGKVKTDIHRGRQTLRRVLRGDNGE